MNRQIYKEEILEHYQDPLNNGEVENADLESEVSNPHCGDEFRFTASVDDTKFSDIRFEGEGCALSTAAASLLTEELSGGEIDRVKKLEGDELFELLGVEKENITPIRQKCVLLAKEGLEKMVKEHDRT